MDNVVPLKRLGYIEVEQCDLDVEEELRAAYAVNGPVVSIIAEFREQVVREALSASTQVEVMREALEEATRCLTWIANLGYEGAPDIAMRKAARDSLAHIAALSAQAKKEGE